MKTILQSALEAETFVVCYFESTPPEWINLKVEPARHLICININGIPGKIECFEDNCSDPKIKCLSNAPPENQLKHLTRKFLNVGPIL